MITEKEIEQAYEELIKKQHDYNGMSEGATEAKKHYETLMVQSLILLDVDGKKLNQGKNPTEREAIAQELYPAQYQEYLLLDEGLRYSKYALDIARIKVEELRLKMRLMEVLKGETDQG